MVQSSLRVLERKTEVVACTINPMPANKILLKDSPQNDDRRQLIDTLLTYVNMDVSRTTIAVLNLRAC